MTQVLKFDIRIQILAIAVAVALALAVIQLVRRRRLSEAYSIMWVGLSAIVLVLALFRDIQEIVARIVGVYYPPSLILGALIFVLLGISLYFSIVLTRLEIRCRILAQRLALLEERTLDSSEANLDDRQTP